MSSDFARDRPGSTASSLSLPGRFRAVIFDLDGVLVDTEPGWQRAEAELLRRHGDTYTQADAAASLGTPVDAVVARYAKRLGLGRNGVLRLRDELMELARIEYGAAVPVQPGAVELVRALQGQIPLGVASNTPRELVLRALEAAALIDCFGVVVTAEDVALAKPAPDIYLLACDRLGVDPSTAVALEDSAPGIEAARRAGLTVVAIPGRPDVDASAADHLVYSLAELRANPRG